MLDLAQRDVLTARAGSAKPTAVVEAELRVFVHSHERYLAVKDAIGEHAEDVNTREGSRGDRATIPSNKGVRVFFSYSHADGKLRDQLEKHLAVLRRQGIIAAWHDRRIPAGQDFANAIDDHVEVDDIILLLVSSDFLASDYCYEKEMIRALARHETGSAVVIPVILRACDWRDAPFGKLNATPMNGTPVMQLPDIDEAWLQVVNSIRQAALQRAQSLVTTEDRAKGR